MNSADPTPGPEGQDEDDARLADARTEAHLREPGRIGVVDDRHRPLEGRSSSAAPGVEVDPARVDVRRRLRHAVDDDRRDADADRGVVRYAAGLLDRARLTVRAIARTTSAGVDGAGVATRRRGADEDRPGLTSTMPTLIPLPPTSTPIATAGASGASALA